MREDEKVRPFSEIQSLAALDSTHLAIALHQPQGEDIFLSTVDGGKTWIPTHVINTFAGNLFAHEGEYWAFGIEYLGRENNPGGGYSVSVVLHSHDTRTWQHGVRPTKEFNGCTAQGCFLPYGVVDVLYGTTEKNLSLPQDLPTTSKWAMAGSRVCMVGQDLKCGTVLASEMPQPAPENASSEMFQATYNQPYLAECLDCHLHSIAPDPSLGGRNFALKNVIANLRVRRDGSISDVSLTGLPSKTLGDEFSRQMISWVLAPAHESGVTVPTQRQLKLVVACFNGFPGHPETANCTVRPQDEAGSFSPSITVLR
jgi:hypothetical protein